MAAKKPGIKDISSLKAKLGLQKPGAAGKDAGVGKTPAAATAGAIPVAAPPGATPVPAGPPGARPIPSAPAAPPPRGAPPGGAPILPAAPVGAQPEPEPEPDPFLAAGSSIPSGAALFGGGGTRAQVAAFDDGLFVTDSEDEILRQASNPREKALLIGLGVVPAVIAMVVAFIYGSGAFGREYHATRLREVDKLVADVDKTVTAINEVKGKVDAVKVDDIAAGLSVAEWVGGNFTESDLIKKELLAGKQIAFLQGSTAAALLTYAKFSRELWTDVSYFARKTWNSRDELKSLSASGSAPKEFGAIIMPNEKAFESYLVLIVEKVDVTAEDTKVDGRFGDMGLKAGDKMCKVKLADDAAPDWRPCAGSCAAVEGIGACLVPIPDSDMIPKQDDALLKEYGQRLAHIKSDLADAAKMGEELITLLEAEKTRATSLSHE